MNEPVLEARNLTRTFGGNVALDNLNISVGKGEVVCLLGANGAGKTTTLNLFLGFVAPSSGEARVHGRSVADAPDQARKSLAYVPEVVSLYPTLTAIETLQYFNDVAGRPPLSSETVSAMLGEAGLSRTAWTERLGSFSKGMRQKVGLALGLAKGADALLLDEPLSGLDPSAANDLVGRIRTLADKGTTVLMATHDIFRAHDIADRLCIMRGGRLVHTVNSADINAAAAEQLYLEHMREAA